MMPDIYGNDVVDRPPIIISGLGVDQLLEVPKLPRSPWRKHSCNSYNVVQEWRVIENVKCMCFDTTTNNTGL